jgi:Secretion system C-terminal sorting domain
MWAGMGLNYYRLRQIDFNGIGTLGNLVSVEWSPTQFNVFPNPISDIFEIKSDADWDKVVVRNAQGQIVRTFLSTEKTTLVGLESGVYWLEIFESPEVFPETIRVILR